MPKKLPSLESIIERHKIACDFKQAVVRPAIERALLKWAKGISAAPVTVRFLETEAEIIQAARVAWDARVARDARVAWDARVARVAWVARVARVAWDARVARVAWVARVARDARDAWDAWDTSWISITALGALELSDRKTFETWLPLLEALEAGAWHFYITDKELLVCTIPEAVCVDEQRRLHNASASAFSWLDVRDYYWHGVYVTQQIIEAPETLTVAQIEQERNAEVRRVMIDRMGIERFALEARMLLVDEVPEFGARRHPLKLYRWQSKADHEAVFAVCVKNATPESDGAFKDYFIEVDPSAYRGEAGRKAHAAIASTWRRLQQDGTAGEPYFRDYHDYKPGKES